MKAAVLQHFGDTPRYQEFAEPVAQSGELLLEVKAVPLENIDKAVAAGTHYASQQFLTEFPAIVGFDGIGALADGRLVGFGGIKPPFGAMAERVVVPAEMTVPVPEGIDAITAATHPASMLTALHPLKRVAKLQPGETVLINGATGVSGKIAIQIARLLGAGRLIGTGRNPVSLQRVRQLGADAVIDLTQDDDAVVDALRKQSVDGGYDVILDFLWGHPTELLLRALTPERLAMGARNIRLVQIGEKAGATVTLAASAIRTSGIEIMGGGAGITAEAIAEGMEQVWTWIRDGSVTMDVEIMPLSDIEAAWRRDDFEGRRIVIVP